MQAYSQEPFNQAQALIKKRVSVDRYRYIRSALYMAALSASQHDPHVRGFYLHMVEDNGLTNLGGKCAVMRKLLMAIHGMQKEDKSFDPPNFFNCLGN